MNNKPRHRAQVLRASRLAKKRTVLQEFCEAADSKARRANDILNEVIRETAVSGKPDKYSREDRLFIACCEFQDANQLTRKILGELVARLGNDCLAIEYGTDLSFQLKEANQKIDFLMKANESLSKACAVQQRKLNDAMVKSNYPVVSFYGALSEAPYV